MKIFYSPECLKYEQPGHPESPDRVEATAQYLRWNGFELGEPHPCSDQDVLLAHSADLLESVKAGTFFDFDTPVFQGIDRIAKLSAGAAVDAVMHCLNHGEKAFSLMRPPGHHAARDRLGGFCYFNSIAIACLKAMKENADIRKVAIVDFDCHHGNGTEDIMLGRKEIYYLSLHQSPLFPGTGLKSRDNCRNIPLLPGTGPDRFLSVFADEMMAVESFGPDLLAISAGFDAFRLDPMAGLSLEIETFGEIGRRLSALNKPTFAVLEGGYSKNLPECVNQFLTGLEEK
ncbi:MAG: histone deacetylase [Nitrospiraceae bacterium]|nr:MAG: histone deacetylase [Nitrospiraceae bacterium]